MIGQVPSTLVVPPALDIEHTVGLVEVHRMA